MKGAALAMLLFLVAWGLGALSLADPRVVSSETRSGSLIADLFGNARNAMSAQFVYKADVYFHGGATPPEDCDGHDPVSEAEAPSAEGKATGCEEDHDNCEDHDHHHDHHDCEDHDHHHDHAAAEGQDRSTARHLGGWFARMHAEVRPQGHRHLSGPRYEKEILPWLWVALKADPHHVDAALAAVYWLNRLNRPEEALQVLATSIQGNPEVAILELERGRLLRQMDGRGEEAYQAFLLGYEKSLRREADLADDDGGLIDVRVRLLSYLSAMDEENGDLEAALRHIREASSILPEHEPLRRRRETLQARLQQDEPE